MRTITRALVVMSLAMTISAVAAAQKKTLYVRLGGTPALEAVVGEFIGRAAGDGRINMKFARTDIPRLKAMLIEQLCEATGGPCKYSGRSMKTAHKGMKVTEGEFNALVEDLVGALDKFNVPDKEKHDLLDILGPLKAQIVEVKGDKTGTPLPRGYKNAKPLMHDSGNKMR
jgi:hemoglobin